MVAPAENAALPHLETGFGSGSFITDAAVPVPPRGPWWKVWLFNGMVNDIRRRAPYYGSDWADALDYRVVPATVYMYFAKYVIQQSSYILDSLKLSALC
jgi:hypothetical protein